MSGRISWEGWAVTPGHEAVRAIAAETPDSELIRWVDEALREKSGYTLPPKIHRDVTLKLIRYHDHQQRIMDLFREDPNVRFVLCDTYEEVIGGSDLVFAANIYGRAAVPDTPYRYCREKYFI